MEKNEHTLLMYIYVYCSYIIYKTCNSGRPEFNSEHIQKWKKNGKNKQKTIYIYIYIYVYRGLYILIYINMHSFKR